MDQDFGSYNGARPQEGVSQDREFTGNSGQIGGAKQAYPDGIYRHPNGAEIITLADPLFGDGQSRAAVRAGFEYVGPAEEGSIKTLGAPSTEHESQPERKVEEASTELAELRARLNALEKEQATRDVQDAHGTTTPGVDPVKGQEDTKQAAADKTERQTGTAVDPQTGDTKTDDEDKSYRDLQSEAKELDLNAGGSADELKQRIADAKAGKETK